MKILLVAINARYIHSNLAVYTLKACAEQAMKTWKNGRKSGSSCPEEAVSDTAEPVCSDRALQETVQIELAEYTINHRAAEILDDIYLREADVLCFSCYIWNIEYVKTLVKNLKRLCPGVPIWLGGPEVSYELERQFFEIPEIDGILYGEGEESFPRLVQYYVENQGKIRVKCGQGKPESSPVPFGCAWRRPDGTIGITPPAPFTDMGKIPFVYQNLKEFENRIPYYETSRGCPFSCSYCLSSIDKTLRFRPLNQVFSELFFFLEHKVPQVKLVDRTFNCKEKRAMEIWQFLRDHDNGITNFHFEIEADILGPEALELLKTLRPGLIQLEIGVQSANPKTLEAIHRRTDLTKLKEITGTIRSGHNIHQHLDLIAGLPWEDYESFGRSFDVVYGMKPDQLQLGFLKVLRGTSMYEDAKRYQILYQAEAPYEVLETPWLSHKEVIRLKQVEDMTEIYYNSGQFPNTLNVLVPLYGTAFGLFEALGKAYREAGMNGKKHVRAAVYEFLLETAGTWFPAEKERLRGLLTLDFYLRENVKKRPAFCVPELSHEEERELFIKIRPELSMKELLRRFHVERINGEICIFDYERRDILTGNAGLFPVLAV